jgi:hypothetical protein
MVKQYIFAWVVVNAYNLCRIVVFLSEMKKPVREGTGEASFRWCSEVKASCFKVPSQVRTGKLGLTENDDHILCLLFCGLPLLHSP